MLMTLWSIFRSPLMFGGDLPTSNAETIALLTNPESGSEPVERLKRQAFRDRDSYLVAQAENPTSYWLRQIGDVHRRMGGRAEIAEGDCWGLRARARSSSINGACRRN